MVMDLDGAVRGKGLRAMSSAPEAIENGKV
jgi:hypothetical protein